MMAYTVVTAPSIEPINIDDVKTHLRILPDDITEDDEILSPLITAAREYAENYTGRALAVQTIKAYPDKFERRIRLPRPPIVSIASITYTDADGSTAALTDYVLDKVSGEVYIANMPTVALAAVNPIEITYTAGYTALPMPIRQAMLLLIGHWYTNRESVVIGAFTSIEVELTVRSLLNMYKVWWF